MKKKIDLKLISILCVVVLVFLALSTSALSAKKEKVEEWIGVEGGYITLGDVTITFGPNVLTKDTKIFIIYFGNGVYQCGPEIKIEEGKTFTLFFKSLADVEVTWIETFEQGEWEKLECNYGEVVTNHFSRYRAFR
ncbi:unnamed protein product [marine sediment metagenome]|uniref:Uncharacterized protein n=1 Tax=marine sediment metagenome TaxID=412755 RepID=X0Z2E8_9ZZZZ